MTRSKFLKIAFLTGIIIALFLHAIDSDGDFFQHINIGKFIVENHTFPHFDNLTFTAFGREYIGYAWGAGVIFYLLYLKLGYLAVNFFVLGTALLTFGFLLWYFKLLLKRLYPNNSSENASLITSLIIAPLIATRFPTRPEIFQFPLVVFILVTEELALITPWKIYFLPLIILLWTNFYGSSALLGLGIIGILLFFKFLSSSKNRLPIGKVNLLHQGIAFCLSIGAAFLTPYGLKSLFFIQFIPKMTELWGDWGGIIRIMRQADFYGFPGYIIVLCVILLVFVIALVLNNRKLALKYPAFLLFALSLFIPFLAIRHRALAALLSAPLLAILISQLSQKSQRLLTISAAIMIFVVVAMSPPTIGSNDLTFPHKMVTFMKGHQLSGRVFNTQQIGSFLEYSLSPQVKTFSDTRDELFIGTNTLESIAPVLSSGTSLNLILRKYRIEIVILSVFDGNSYKDLLHDPRWTLVYFDNTYMIFIPTQVAQEKDLPNVTFRSL